MFQPVPPKPSFSELEERILGFWRERRIFQKSLEQRQGAPLFVFYEGPPTVNARPGVHHALSRVFKDIFPRYKTMKGYCVPRKAGWDCHGLPVELEVEQELGVSTKMDIESYGVGRFNERCRQNVLRHIKEWEQLTERIGFWLDMEHPYITMENDYIESCWWIMKELWQKGLIYQGYKVTPHCPRCGTSLSSHEVALGYEEVDDPSIWVKFKVADAHRLEQFGADPDLPAYFLAWTTTPWTLPGNTALAVAADAEYAVVEVDDDCLILADALRGLVGLGDYKVMGKVKGRELVGVEYEPLYNPDKFGVKRLEFETIIDFSRRERKEIPTHEPSLHLDTYPVIETDFVSMEEGTGIVHIAPAYGEVDYEAGWKNDLDFVHMVDLQGKITGTYPFSGLFVKDADPLIIEDLKSRGLLYRSESIRHSYPFCWRCDTPLLYYAKPAWYIKTTALKDRLIAGNAEINWYPEHIKYGRFGDWLNNNVDWACSRERYWGTPLPIWKCNSCDKFECVGSVAELKTKPGLSGFSEPLDLHRPFVDDITFACSCGGIMRRVPEVLDCWFDSGAMPLAQWHYPFQNETLLRDGRFPADFISEAVDQTRGWFYSLHALSVLLFDSPCFRNVICLGHILDSEGEKMSKSKGNAIDPWLVLSRFGADTLRWHLVVSSPPGNSRRLSLELVAEPVRKFLLPLWNTYSFFVIYANIDKFDPRASTGGRRSELDRWVLSELNRLIKDVTDLLEGYDPTSAGRKFEEFIDGLSNWYVRRSRRRFWKSESDADKEAAHATLYHCLVTLTKLVAPFIPFIAEELFQNLVLSIYPEAPESVHLADFPVADEAMIDDRLASDTRLAMKVSSLGRAARSKAGIKVRQPLSRVLVKVKSKGERDALERVKSQVVEELNVKDMNVVDSVEEFMTVTESVVDLKDVETLETTDVGKNGIVLSSTTLKKDANGHLFGHRRNMKDKPGYVSAHDVGSSVSVAIDTELTPELAEEGLAREIVHRLQMMRKQAGFDIADYIETYYQGGPATQRVMERFSPYIRQETLSRNLLPEAPPSGAYVETHRIATEEVVLGVRK
jgi:isoleucyl-tRNA synthetase